ncbi:MAG TPA: DUF397 domain-containing protein, partial [Micromonosporaceae bacterium]|nr:DUF397 domain-containing protein [Micromonosporaceae bacterium]
EVRDLENTPKWVRSSRCGPIQGNCVEVGFAPPEVIVRDSKRGAARLVFGHTSWIFFLHRCAGPLTG